MNPTRGLVADTIPFSCVDGPGNRFVVFLQGCNFDCVACHNPATAFMDQQMHDLKLERFYAPGETVNDFVAMPDGPIKTFTLRGIKDSPPYLHDGRLMTLADTVEFFNLVLGTKLSQPEKDSLVAYMLTL